MSLSGKVILLTGGTGSFGKKFAEIVLNEYKPRTVRIFSRGELLQMQMQRQFGNHPALRFFIGDVRDRNRLSRSMVGADIVVHAAAMKQVPTCEYNPLEAVKTNIDGAANIIDVAIDRNVEKVMAISTDKAVQPINLYGATKLVAEKLFIQGNAYAGGLGTKFSVVRYGNVVGSRGSVLPLFLEQREKGKLTITDDRMTRFWITIEQGVRFAIECINSMHGGEVFVPKIPSMKLVDLAKVIAPDAEQEFTGIRPGEKIDEILLTNEEARHSREFDKYYVIDAEVPLWNTKPPEGGKKLADPFTYSSGNNDQWLSEADLKRMLSDSGIEI